MYFISEVTSPQHSCTSPIASFNFLLFCVSEGAVRRPVVGVLNALTGLDGADDIWCRHPFLGRSTRRDWRDVGHSDRTGLDGRLHHHFLGSIDT